MASKPYNGHKNWNHWNVSLWINNDEGLYRLALDCVRRTRNAREAAQAFIDALMSDAPDWHTVAATNDGAPFTLSSVSKVMVGLRATH